MMMKIIAMVTLLFSPMVFFGQYAGAAEVTDMPGMDHNTIDPSTMDHSTMDHSQMEQKTPAAQPPNKPGNNMQGMDHSVGAGMGGDMGGMSMQGGAAPANARDPHAYSGGYSLGALSEHTHSTYRSGLMVDRLESAQSSDDAFQAYELQGWIGKDYNRLVVKAEGEVASGNLHEARTELLWGHALTPHWDTQLGLRYDSGLAPEQQWLAVGVQGLAPYWFEIDATAYIGEQGRTAVRLSAEYELLLTQKLILQPRVEANLYGKADAERELGSGLSSVTTGLRLRYEIRREFAPYLGVEWNGKMGGTADYARASGERSSETRIIGGVRFWY